MELRLCKSCNIEKPIDEFQKLTYNTSRFSCKACRVEEAKDYRFKKEYGISREEYQEKRKEQDYSCAICCKHEDNHSRGTLFVDHDHETGKYRALLCTQCNSALGMVYDKVDILKKMIDYLEKHK